MKKEVRTVVYDDELHIEAYRFEGIVQPFPNHFHEYYVIGFMEDGERVLSCKTRSTPSQGAMFFCLTQGTTTPVPRVTAGRWITGASTSPRRSCWTWRRKSPVDGSCPDFPKM